jgi:hypothetical protein
MPSAVSRHVVGGSVVEVVGGAVSVDDEVDVVTVVVEVGASDEVELDEDVEVVVDDGTVELVEEVVTPVELVVELPGTVEVVEEVVPRVEVVVGWRVDVDDVVGARDEEVVVVVGFVVDVDVVGTVVVVEVVAPGSDVLVEDVDDVELVEDVDGELVEVVLVEVVVVVVVGQLTPQHGRFGSWTIVGAGVTVPVMTGALVRQSSSFSAVAVSVPATDRPVLANSWFTPKRSPPGPVATSSAVEVTLI